MDHNTTRADLFGRTTRGHTILTISGELDIATTAVLCDRIAAVLDDTALPMIIDLSRVSFCDASGLTMLLTVRRRADAHGCAVALAGPRPNVRKLLRITGLDRVFPIYSTLAQAVLGRVGVHRPAVAWTSVAKEIDGCRTAPARRGGRVIRNVGEGRP